MPTIPATLAQPLEEATATTRRVAGEKGYSLAEGESGPSSLVFKKGASALSWGSKLTVSLAAHSPTETRLTVTTHETWALADWGRGKRAAHRLLDALGAKY